MPRSTERTSAESTFKDRVQTAAYPVEELPAACCSPTWGRSRVPQLLRLDGFVATGTIRMIGQTLVPCNWLQISGESRSTPCTPNGWHGHLQEWVEEQRDGVKTEVCACAITSGDSASEEFEYGIYKRRLMQGQSEDVDDWRVGHPVMFPCIGHQSAVLSAVFGRCTLYQIRVPVDDTLTHRTYWYTAFMPPPGAHGPAETSR